MNTEKLANVNLEIASILASCLRGLRELNDTLMGPEPEIKQDAAPKNPPEPVGYFPYQTALAASTLQTAYDLNAEITRLHSCVHPGAISQASIPESPKGSYKVSAY